jgi:type IV secretion system protein VirB3
MLEKLYISPIFTGLTRPPMVMGITVDYLGISFMFVLSTFIAGNSAKYLILYIPLHVFGWVACKIDHNIFRIFTKKLECLNVPNKRIWGCQSYEPC